MILLDLLQSAALSTPALPTTTSPDRLYEWIAIGVLSGLLAVGALGVLIYLKVLLPRRRRRPLLEALELLGKPHEDQTARERIVERLDRAITGGLAAHDLLEARFALSYLRARMGKLHDARVVALEIKDADADAAVWFLRLWLHAQLKDHRAAIEVWDKHGEAFGAFPEAKRIAAICYLSEALALWRREVVDGAVEYFKAMAKLDISELAKHVPTHIDQHQIVQGIRALHNGQSKDARKSFESARTASDPDGAAALAADTGMLLCEWSEQRSPDIDDRLLALIERCERLVRAANDQAQTSEPRRVFAGLLLWHAVSWLFLLRDGCQAGTGLSGDDRRVLYQRLKRTEAADPELPDPRLIRGLINYYFAPDPEQRSAAVADLKQVSETGVQVPEVAELVRKEERLKRSLEEGLSSYLRLGRKYLTASHVSLARRKALREYLERFEQFRTLDPIDENEAKAAASPSVAQLSSRVRDMRAKLARVVRPGAAGQPEATHRIEASLTTLDSATKSLVDTAQTVETAEYDLMITAGEFFIAEEHVRSLSPPAGSGSPPRTTAPERLSLPDRSSSSTTPPSESHRTPRHRRS
jgi:tetratricopeptide (TPR) repeat protein